MATESAGIDMATVPPFPYPANGKGALWIEVNGKRIYVFGANGSGKFNLSDWPTDAIDSIAHWEIAAKKADPNKWSNLPSGKAQNWLNKHDAADAETVLSEYANYAANGGGTPTPTASPLPGAETATKGITSVTDFLNLLTEPNTWLRIAEFAIGAIAIAVALATMSKTVNKAVKLTPAGRLL